MISTQYITAVVVTYP